jgi:hypothetical protein
MTRRRPEAGGGQDPADWSAPASLEAAKPANAMLSGVCIVPHLSAFKFPEVVQDAAYAVSSERQVP